MFENRQEADGIKIGENIKRLRLKNGLTQEEVADRCELSKGFISQLERELTSPSIATLIDILECLGTDLKGFFSDSRNEKTVFAVNDISVKKNEVLGYEISWLISNSQKNMMEPILLKLMPGGRTDEDEPHQGEEFGYVISGRAMLVLGDRVLRVKAGESFYFKPSENHYIENRGKRKVQLIWISSPPSF